MSEAYPVFTGEKLGYVASTSEFTVYGEPGLGRRVYIWYAGRAYPVDWRVYRFGDAVLDVRGWAVYAPLEAWRFVRSLDEYIEMLAKVAGEKLRGRKLLLSFSGGKDSTAALIVLDALSERVDFKLHVIHVHMPFLEPEYHIDEAERIASKLGYSIEVVEPPRRVLVRRLLREGLPWRRARWCTYYKTRPLEEVFEKINADYMVVGDRIGESITRARRLKPSDFFDKRRFEPIKFLSLIDVVILTRKYGLVHRDYTRGLLRVSCRYCPYRGISELLIDGRIGDEDPGLIDEVLRREWRSWYRDYVPLDAFIEEHLWRYVPRVAGLFYRAKLELSKSEKPTLTPEDVAALHRSVWEVPLERLLRTPVVRVGPAEEVRHVSAKGVPPQPHRLSRISANNIHSSSHRDLECVR